MKNCVKLILSVAIGAVVGVVTYLSTKSNRSDNTCNNQSMPSRLDDSHEDCNRSGNTSSIDEETSRNNFKVYPKDNFLEFLGNSQSGLERLLKILKNIALSLEYMTKLFANSGIRALPQYSYC